MILVTGAAGLNGSLVIRELARQQVPVRALVRNRAKARELETFPTVEVVEGDMLQPLGEGTSLAPIDVEDIAKIAAAMLRANAGAHHGRRYEMTGLMGSRCHRSRSGSRPRAGVR